MEQVQVTLPVRRFGETSRRDAWWVQPVAVVAGLGTAIAYMTWAAFQGANYAHLGYLHPSIRRSCSAVRRMRGSDRSPAGGQPSCPFRRRF